MNEWLPQQQCRLVSSGELVTVVSRHHHTDGSVVYIVECGGVFRPVKPDELRHVEVEMTISEVDRSVSHLLSRFTRQPKEKSYGKVTSGRDR